jgi:hypothetical protein
VGGLILSSIVIVFVARQRRKASKLQEEDYRSSIQLASIKKRESMNLDKSNTAYENASYSEPQQTPASTWNPNAITTNDLAPTTENYQYPPPMPPTPYPPSPNPYPPSPMQASPYPPPNSFPPSPNPYPPSPLQAPPPMGYPPDPQYAPTQFMPPIHNSPYGSPLPPPQPTYQNNVGY